MNLGMETETVEYKKSTSEMREGMESIASILNKHGHGTLYFGVRNDGEVVGQDVSEKTLRDVSQAVGNRIEPRIYPQIECLETEDGRAYVRVEFSGDERPYACDGRYRIRTSDEDSPMSTAMLESMMLERAAGRDPWDGRSSGRTVADVDEEVLRQYVERGLAARRIPFGYTDPRDAIAGLGLLCDDGTLTNAAAVCFAPSREVMLRMGVFGDSARVNILDNQQVRGTLFSMVDEAEDYILNNTRRAFVIDGSSLHRREVPEVPVEAVREALFNAFCHRDYLDDAAVQVDIFWDHVDIYSPGLFPPGYDPSEYLAERETASKPRNKLIATTLYRSGDIEAYGTGLRRIRDACAKQGVPFSVTQSAHGVHVSFTRQEGIAAASADNTPKSSEEFRSGSDNVPTNSDKVPTSQSTPLTANERRVVEYMSAHGTVTATEVAGALGVTSRTVRNIMGRLAERGLVTPAGANRNRTYALSDDE